jgi:G3E family GTPase
MVDVFETLEHLCLCCTPREELEEVLEAVSQAQFDHIIIESTGLADPAFLKPVLERSERFVLHNIICVVEPSMLGMLKGENGLRSIEEEQLAIASIVVVPTKQDTNICFPKAYSEGRKVVAMEEAIKSFFSLKNPQWSIRDVVASDARYFAEKVPYRRHQKVVSWASLINVRPLSEEMFGRLLGWLKSVVWMRLKGTVYIEGGRKCLIDGFKGNVRVIDLPEGWKAAQEVPSNKLAFVGLGEFMSSSFELQLQLEKDLGLVMQPTVLYSAPAPKVDTFWQRFVVLLTAGAVQLTPVHLDYKIWMWLALVVYLFLSSGLWRRFKFVK